MILWRNFIVYSLVLVLLPWGAWANAVASGHGNTAMQHQTVAAIVVADEGSIAPKQKRCRIAVLAGISCVADGVWHRPAAFVVTGQVLRNAYFAKVTLPRGVSPNLHPHPPRHG